MKKGRLPIESEARCGKIYPSDCKGTLIATLEGHNNEHQNPKPSEEHTPSHILQIHLQICVQEFMKFGTSFQDHNKDVSRFMTRIGDFQYSVCFLPWLLTMSRNRSTKKTMTQHEVDSPSQI
jgi:hypothetical protein